MEEQQADNKPFNHRRRGRGRFIRSIQRNAFNPRLPNGIKKELTYQQALSILLRSKQLIREGSYHPYTIAERNRMDQIDECYRQREFEKQ